MAGYRPYPEYRESRFAWGCDALMDIIYPALKFRRSCEGGNPEKTCMFALAGMMATRVFSGHLNNVNIEQYSIGTHAANAGFSGAAMPLLPLKKILTVITVFTIVIGNTPAKPRLAPASTLKSRGFFYAWRKQA